MISEANLTKLEQLVVAHGGQDATELSAAVADLQTALAAQSLLVRNLLLELRNRRASAAALDGILTAATLSATMASIGVPKRNAFSVAEAEQRVSALNDAVAAAGDFGQVLGSLVEVAKVFT